MAVARLEKRFRAAVRWLIAGYIVLSIGVSLGIYLNYRNNQQDEKRAIAADARQINAIRTIMCFAQRQTATSKQRTIEEKKAAVKFYDDALAQIHAKPCPHIKFKGA